MKKEKVMDWTTFIGTVAVLLFAVIPMMAFPKASEDIITGINSAFLIQLVRYIYLWGWRFFAL
ncbi:High-affinity choline uptake protein BetT [Staphylococcus argenteus]|nr:High-affinity choline uptake protein BetT [Staphylococcus argenteus]